MRTCEHPQPGIFCTDHSVNVPGKPFIATPSWRCHLNRLCCPAPSRSMSSLARSLSHISTPLMAPTTREAKFTVPPKTSPSSTAEWYCPTDRYQVISRLLDGVFVDKCCTLLDITISHRTLNRHGTQLIYQ